MTKHDATNIATAIVMVIMIFIVIFIINGCNCNPNSVPKADPQRPIANGYRYHPAPAGTLAGPTAIRDLMWNGTQWVPRPDMPPIGWGNKQTQEEIERVHAAMPKHIALTPPALPAFYPIKHTQSIPQVLVTCTSAGAQQHLIWTNTLGMVAVAEGTAWLGVDMGAIEDAYILAINLNSGDVWVVTNEDHYSDRTGGAASANISFGGSPFPWLLNPNDQIEVLIGCRGLANYHIGASLTFQYLSPAPAPTPAAQGGTK